MDESKNQPASPAPDPIRPGNPLFKKLGSCCECGTREAVHNIIFLNRKCVIRGHGWGCHICGLPPDGAVIVLCKSCMQRFEAGLIKIRLASKATPWSMVGYRSSNSPNLMIIITESIDFMRIVLNLLINKEMRRQVLKARKSGYLNWHKPKGGEVR